MVNRPLYNSRLMKLCLDYFSKQYPGIDVDLIINRTGIKIYEIEDPGHWFSQKQTDDIFYILAELSKDDEFYREAGRFIALSDALGTMKQFMLGLISPLPLYGSMDTVYAKMSRGIYITTNKVSDSEINLTATSSKDADTKKYQCEVTIGVLEALPLLFASDYATVTHDKCIHNGDDECVFNVQWENTTAVFWLKMRKLLFLFGFLLIPFCYSFFSPMSALLCFFISTICVLVVSQIADGHKKSRLTKIIASQGNAAKDLLEEANFRNSKAELVKEISNTKPGIKDPVIIAQDVINAISKYLNYEQALFFFIDEKNENLVLKGNVGLNDYAISYFNSLNLENNYCNFSGIFIKTFNENKPALHDASILKHHVNSSNTLNEIHWQEKDKLNELISVPIKFDEKVLGVLAVCSLEKNEKLLISDLSLIAGIASQLGASINYIHTQLSYEENETKYRKLVIQAQENERKKIAFDLHDNVAQDLGTLKIISTMYFENYPELFSRDKHQFSEILQRTISSIRNISYDLQPPILNELGLAKALKSYCDDYSLQNAIVVNYMDIGLDNFTFDFDLSINVYRIVIEALNNIKKHAYAKNVEVKLVASYPLLIIVINDDGYGFIPGERIPKAISEKRMGIRSMEERTALLKGKFRINSKINKGTKIKIKIPVRDYVDYDENDDILVGA